MEQPRAAKNLLGNALQTLLQIVAHVRGDVILGHGGLLHQNQRSGLIAWGKDPTYAPHDCPAQQQRYQKVKMSAPHEPEIMLQVKTFRAFLFQIVNHKLSSQWP